MGKSILTILELKCTWISKSNSKQRAGRAGRVQNGHYYALFPKSRFESLGKAVPDIHRADLHEVCLSAKVRSPETSIKDYLAAAIEPPNPRALDKAIQSLRDMNALTKDEEITPLGNLLASLPLHPTIGRMVVLGIVFRCLDPLLILCAASSSKRLFVHPFGEESKAEAAHRNFDKGYNSDPVRFVEAFTSACRVQMQGKVEYEEFMRDHYLDTRAFETIQRVIAQIKNLLMNEGLLPRSSFAHHFPNLNENSGNFALIRALSIYRGNLACRDTAILFRTGRGDRTSIIMGAKSVNHPYQKGNQEEGKLGLPYHAIVSFGEMRRTDDGAFALENTTLISPIAAALFASDLELDPEGTTLTLDKWLRLTVKSGPGLPAEEDISTTILLFREAWDMILSSAFSRLSRRKPINHYKQQPFVDALVAVVSRDLGDEDMRRLVNGIVKEQERKTKLAKSTKLYDWQAMEKARVDRLESYLSETY
jgi:ATP-dependent RNA helicase DHX36